MSTDLAQMTPAFRDAVHGAQQTFRTLLDAMSRPGRVLALPAAVLDGLEPPVSHDGEPAMGPGTAAVLLTLLDPEISVRLHGAMATPAALAYLRFHSGVRVSEGGAPAEFTVARAVDVDAPLWNSLELGSDEVPQRGVTLVVEVEQLGEGSANDTIHLQLRGPGIESLQALAVTGLPPAFWHWRMRLLALLPRGVDLVLTCGRHIAAVPRTARIALEA